MFHTEQSQRIQGPPDGGRAALFSVYKHDPPDGGRARAVPGL